MAAIVWSDVVAHAPELAIIAAGAQTDILAYVNAALNVTLYDGESGAQTRLARILYAAHIGTLEHRGSAGGALIGSSAGGLSRTYAAPLVRSQLATTGYGQLFLQLLPPAARGPQVT